MGEVKRGVFRLKGPIHQPPTQQLPEDVPSLLLNRSIPDNLVDAAIALVDLHLINDEINPTTGEDLGAQDRAQQFAEQEEVVEGHRQALTPAQWAYARRLSAYVLQERENALADN